MLIDSCFVLYILLKPDDNNVTNPELWHCNAMLIHCFVLNKQSGECHSWISDIFACICRQKPLLWMSCTFLFSEMLQMLWCRYVATVHTLTPLIRFHCMVSCTVLLQNHKRGSNSTRWNSTLNCLSKFKHTHFQIKKDGKWKEAHLLNQCGSVHCSKAWHSYWHIVTLYPLFIAQRSRTTSAQISIQYVRRSLTIHDFKIKY